jgi:UPF0755 protein
MMRRLAPFLVGLIIAVPLAFGAALLVPTRLPANAAKPVLVTIPQGEPSGAISKRMASSGVIGSRWLFALALRLTQSQNKLLAGDYAFPKGQSPLGLALALRSGKYRLTDIRVTVPEGFTREQIAARLAANSVAAESDFLELTAHPTAELVALVPGLPTDASLEGYLFPDTYRFGRGSTVPEVVKKFLQNFAAQRAKLPAATGSATGRTFNEIVILGSILEREVKTETERRMVADLFWRRLDAGIALQADITTAYAVGKTIEKLTPEDYANPSPYNTYQHRGLPPGPISNPGSVSLAAALNPEPNEYFYFLTDPKTTAAVYARTLEEHNQNKAKYLGK